MDGKLTQFMRPIGVQGLDMGVPFPDPTKLPWPELVWAHRRRGPELQAASGPAPTGPHSPARADTAPWRPRASSRPQPVTRPGERKEPGRPRRGGPRAWVSTHEPHPVRRSPGGLCRPPFHSGSQSRPPQACGHSATS